LRHTLASDYPSLQQNGALGDLISSHDTHHSRHKEGQSKSCEQVCSEVDNQSVQITSDLREKLCCQVASISKGLHLLCNQTVSVSPDSPV